MKIGYLGPKGTYCYGAARSLQKEGDVLLPFSTISEAALSAGGAADISIVPFDNTLEGAVTETADVLIWDCALKIVQEIVLPVRHRIFIKEGARLEDVRRLYTHSHAYRQCKKSIERLLPRGTEIIFSLSTAAGFDYLDASSAVIAGQFAENPGAMSVCDIFDAPAYTRFAVLSDGLNRKSEKITVAFEAEHKPGGLLDILGIFKSADINMSRIESRPHRERIGRYVFTVDLEADISDERVNLALDKVGKATVFYKLLGAYNSSRASG